jgi:DNA repair protein RadA/Sms
VQSLVSTAVYGTPQRSSTGYDVKRLNMLLAVLEKKAGFKLSSKDVFLNIAGGIKLTDPAMDLPIIMAILSSNFDFPIRKDVCFCAEIGLSGEIRPVTRAEQRMKEADKLGFKKIFIARGNYKAIAHMKKNISVDPFGKIEDLVKEIFTNN